jgi:hypothetical protein
LPPPPPPPALERAPSVRMGRFLVSVDNAPAAAVLPAAAPTSV